MEWKLIGVEQITHKRFLNYFILHYEVDGKPYEYYLASRKSIEELRAKHEASSYRPDGVLMVLVDKRNGEEKVAVIEEFRPCFNKYITSLPAGLLDEGETIIEAARREAREEIGVEIDNVRILFQGSPTTEGLTDEMVAAVYGEITSLVHEEREFAEDISWRLLGKEEIEQVLADPTRLVPVPTRLALLLAVNRVKLPQ